MRTTAALLAAVAAALGFGADAVARADGDPAALLEVATPAEPGAVVAIVLDADRRPLVGVPVEAVAWRDEPDDPPRPTARHADLRAAACLLGPPPAVPAPAATAVTDVRGEAALDGLEGDRLYVVTARPAAPLGAATATVRARAAPRGPFVALVAREGRALALRVRGARGRGVEADVELALADGERPWDATASRWAGARVRTGSDGRVRVLGVPRTTLLVTVRAADAVLVATRPDAGDAEVELALSEGVDVQGVVLDAGDRPVADARVLVAGASDDPRVVARVRAATSGPDGRFLVEGAGVGEARLVEVRAAGLVPTPATEAATASVPLSATGRQTLAVRCEPASSVGGTVRGPDGRPVAGARVQLLDPEGRRAPSDAVADAAGAWRVDGLPRGRGVVVVEADGLRLDAPHAVAAGFREPTGVPVAFERPGTRREVAVALARAAPASAASVAGRVRRADGTPAAGALVVLDRWLTGPDAPGVVATRADGAGRYRFDGVRFAKGHVAVRTDAELAESGPFELAPGDLRVVDLALVPAPRVVGTVRDGAGRPVAGVEVAAHVDPGRLIGRGDRAPRPVGLVEVTDADGRYALGPVERLAFVVLPVVDGTARFPRAVEPFSDPRLPWTYLSPVVGRVGVDLTLPATASLVGAVLHADGTPAAGWTVSARPTARGYAARGHVGGRTTTDATGRFRLEHLPPGPWHVSAGDASVVVEARDAAEVRLVVGERARRTVLEGTVTTEDGRVVATARVRFEPWGSVAVVGGVLGGALRAGADDRFDVGALHVEDARDAAGDPLDAAPVSLRVEGPGPVRVVLPRAPRVEGRVVGPDGVAVAGALVLGYREGRGDAVAWTVTDDDGRFRFVGVSPDVTTVEARDAAGRASRAADLRGAGGLALVVLGGERAPR